MLTHAQICQAISYDPKTGVFRRKDYAPHREAGWDHVKGYRCIRIRGHDFLAHRLAFFIMKGRWPQPDVDHRNGVRNDNRWNNLREATRSQNTQNSKIRNTNTSGVVGVSFDKTYGKFVARITTNGKVWQKYCRTLEEATKARRAAERRYHKFAPKIRRAA